MLPICSVFICKRNLYDAWCTCPQKRWMVDFKNEDFEIPSRMRNPFVAGYCKIQRHKFHHLCKNLTITNIQICRQLKPLWIRLVNRVTYDYCWGWNSFSHGGSPTLLVISKIENVFVFVLIVILLMVSKIGNLFVSLLIAWDKTHCVWPPAITKDTSTQNFQNKKKKMKNKSTYTKNASNPLPQKTSRNEILFTIIIIPLALILLSNTIIIPTCKFVAT